MTDSSKRQPVAAEPKRGEALWRANKEAIAGRNDQARKAGRERRQREYEAYAAEQRAADLRERAELANRRP
jgi:hypothetical protein